MKISAKEVNKLRQTTGAGMMDCKKALTEAEGDFEKAIEILRKKGQKVSAKRADRDAKEGAIFVWSSADLSKAALIELNCETDFVARNEDFQSLGEKIANLAGEKGPEDLEALKALSLDGKSVADSLVDAIGKIGEKIDLSKYEKVSADKVITYIHPGARIGVAVGFMDVSHGSVEEVGRNVAMQIAAMNPLAINEDAVPQSVIEKEREIGMEQARAEGKPEKILDKIATGKVKKFLKDNTLVNQEFVKDTSKSVGKYIQEELGKDVSVNQFIRLQLGAK